MRWQLFSNREGTEVRGGKYMEEGDWKEPLGKVKMFTRGQPQALAWVHEKCRNKWEAGAWCVAAGLWWLWSNWDTVEQVLWLLKGCLGTMLWEGRSGNYFQWRSSPKITCEILEWKMWQSGIQTHTWLPLGTDPSGWKPDKFLSFANN